MKSKFVHLLCLSVISIGFSCGAIAQPKKLVISVHGDSARIDLDTTVYVLKGKDSLIVFNNNAADLVLYIMHENDTIGIVDFNLVEDKVRDKKLFKLLSNYDPDLLYLEFQNPKILFYSEHWDKGIQQLIVKKKGSSLRAIRESEIGFIPPSLSSGVEGWPDYTSEFGNPDYRMAIDLSQSFNSLSLWEFNDSSDTGNYELINTLRPKYGRFLSVNIKGYSPLYDSITSAYKFSNLHLEGKKQFQLMAKSMGGIPEADTNQTEPTLGGTADAVSLNDTTTKNAMLYRLKSDLIEYENYLGRNVVDQSIWQNDIRYINSRLNKHLGLVDYSTAALRLKLKKYTSDNELIDEIVLSYSRILVYSSYSTIPIQIEDADLLQYELNFYKDGKNVDKRDYRFVIKGGFKIDFSAGIAYSNLKNMSYLIKSAGTSFDTVFYQGEDFITTDSITEINEVNQKQIVLDKEVPNIGATVLAHFYPRTGRLVNLSGTIGFMINTDAEYSYLAGLSLILGKKQRAIISGGGNFGKVDMLSPKYSAEPDKIYTEAELGEVSDSQLTRKEWDKGMFISISYNF